MKCDYCHNDYPMPQLQFIVDGMVPGIQMVRRRAQCAACRKPPNTIDGKPSDEEDERETVGEGGVEYPF